MGASLGSRAVHVMAPRWSPTCSRSLVRWGPRSAVPAAGPPGRGPAAVAPAREQDHGYGITEYVPCDAAFGHPVTVRGQPVTVREQRRPRLRGVGAPRRAADAHAGAGLPRGPG